MGRERLAEAIEACLARAVGQRQPFRHVAEFIDQLESEQSWTADEIAEVQSQMIRSLMNRMGMAE